MFVTITSLGNTHIKWMGENQKLESILWNTESGIQNTESENQNLESGIHKSKKTGSSNSRELFCIAFAYKK